MYERRQNKPGTVFYNDDYLLIRDELTIEQKGRLLDEIMSYSLKIRDRKQYTDDDVENIEPVIDSDDSKLCLYFRWIAAKVKADELKYRTQSQTNSYNRRKAIENQRGKMNHE